MWHVGSDKKGRCSTLVVVVCGSYIYAWGEKRWSMLKKKMGEEIKVMYDEMKKFVCKPQVVMVCIM
jgi:hypothetical protein